MRLGPKQLAGRRTRKGRYQPLGRERGENVDFILVVTAFAALAGIVLPLALMLTVALWGKDEDGRTGRDPARPPTARGSKQRAPGGHAPG